jgi:broad specificity phosphatase PhoE
MRLVHLIRHGEPASGWGEAGGSPDPGLTDKGRAQAQAAAGFLLAMPQEARPLRILTSPLQRCRETAAPLAEHMGQPALVTPAVAEIPTPPGLAGPERAPWLRAAMEGDWADIPGIDGAAWRDSVIAAVAQAQGAAVFTHFVAINACVSAALGSDAVLAFRPAQGSITTLAVEAGGLRVVRLGEGLEEAGRVL